MKKNIYIISFLVFITINLVHPVTPTILSDYGVDKKYFGYLFASMSLGLALFSPLWGKLGDKHGRRLFLMIGIIGYGIGQITFVLTDNIILMLIGRFIAGSMIGATNVNLVAYLTENAVGKERTRALTFFGASSTVALSLGYTIGGYIGVNIGAVNTVYVQAVVSLLVGVLAYFTLTARVVNESKAKKPGIRESFKIIWKSDSKSLLVMFFVLFLVTASYTSAPKYIDLMFGELGYSSGDLGTFVLVTGIISVFVTILLVYPLAKRFDPALLIGSTVILGGITMILAFYIKINFIIAMYSIYNLHVVFKTFHEPLDIAYISECNEIDKGLLMGIRNTIRSFAQVLAPILGGYIYAYNRYYVFYFYGIILVLAGLISFTLIKKKSEV